MSEPNSAFFDVCGVDEVGRGPLAGPVTAAAVVLRRDFDTTPLRDSKALSPTAREHLFAMIVDGGNAVGIGWVWPEEIDRINIHHAALRAMSLAVEELLARSPAPTIHEIRADGRFCPPVDPAIACTAIVGGDHLEPAIMAGSIVAKVTRDRWMCEYARRDDRYGFERHKGYPTPEHRRALASHGPSPIHRRSFRGVSPASSVGV